MQAMSNSDVSPGATETQQMRIMVPSGVGKPERAEAWLIG